MKEHEVVRQLFKKKKIWVCWNMWKACKEGGELGPKRMDSRACNIERAISLQIWNEWE